MCADVARDGVCDGSDTDGDGILDGADGLPSRFGGNDAKTPPDTDGDIAGIFSEVIDIEISKIAESQLRVGEWMVVVNPELGVGLALAQAAAIQDHKRGSHRLWETQLRNLPIIRRLHTAVVARPIRSGYTLHRWASD